MTATAVCTPATRRGFFFRSRTWIVTTEPGQHCAARLRACVAVLGGQTDSSASAALDSRPSRPSCAAQSTGLRPGTGRAAHSSPLLHYSNRRTGRRATAATRLKASSRCCVPTLLVRPGQGRPKAPYAAAMEVEVIPAAHLQRLDTQPGARNQRDRGFHLRSINGGRPAPASAAPTATGAAAGATGSDSMSASTLRSRFDR